MRNEYGGKCYRCGLWVAPGTGHFNRHEGRWRTHHANVEGHGRITCAAAKQQSDLRKNDAAPAAQEGEK